MACVVAAQYLIVKNNYNLNFFTTNNIIKMIFIIMITFIVLYFLFLFLLSKISSLKFGKKDYSEKDLKKIFLFSNICMLLVWLLCFITFYPGGAFYDTYMQINSPIYATTQHPLGYSMLLYLFIVIFGQNIIHSSLIGWAIYSIFQMLCMSLSLSFALTFLAKRKVPKIFLILLLIIFSVTPIYASYSIFATKDILFALILLYLTLLLIKVVETDGKFIKSNIFKYGYILLGIALFQTRMNGSLIYVVISIILIVKYHKFFIKWYYILLLFPLAISLGLNYFIQSKYNISHYFQETVGIPLQQISATVYQNGKLNKKEEQYINQILDLNLIKENYNPFSAHNIKWNSEFNRDYLQETKGEFIITWFTILPKNFKTYVESYLLATYNFWSFNYKARETNMYFDTHSDSQSEFVELVKERYNLKVKDILPQEVNNRLEEFYEKNTNYLGEGTCFWLVIFLTLLVFFKKQNKYLIIFMPLILLWLSLMVAVSISSSLRFMFSFVLLLPILLLFVLNLEKID